MLVDPAGYLVGSVSGEGNYEGIDRAIAATIEDFRKRGELNEQPLKLALERAKAGDLPLAFPGKLLADANSERLFVADSNHNRIVVTKLDGTLVETTGTGEAGAKDGAYDQASFNRPQGLALDGDALYVADTENHLIRRVDLRTRRVATIAGTGQQSSTSGKIEGPAAATALNSPWDLHIVGRNLYIAMAGPHQIWQLNLETQVIGTFAGSGREARLDGPREQAGFAQPSGITSDGKILYVADSESNIIRAIDLASGEVKTLVGGDLFEFGDLDGEGDDVRLQHPLGIVKTADGSLLIADTYNHRIKRLDPRRRTVKSFAGTGKPGQADGSSASSFYEPGGLSIAGDKLFIADTNNHAVRVIDLKSKRSSTLMIKGLRPPDISLLTQAASDDDSAPNRKEMSVSDQRLPATTAASLVVDVTLPEGYHLNASAPQRYKVTVEEGSPKTLAVQDMTARVRKDLQLPLRLPIQTGDIGRSKLRVETTLYFCREDNTGTCRVKTLVWRIPVEVIADKTATPELKAQAEIKLDD
ncbi:MAG: NHL repeat-containing protein [Pyrinomonadaceae bacterium]